tara:strand:- start:57 stop:494 length:438 start_codon:yes stop_codon:yes gene_type:complete
MATSTLIQNLSGTGVVSNRRQTETFLAGAAIVAGDIGKIAMIDVTKTGSDQVLYVRVAAVQATGNGKACGVILNAAAEGEKVEVITAGYASTVQTAGSISAGIVLSPAVAVAGKGIAAVAADVARPFGVVLTTGANPECWVYPQF